jgi:Predicted flavin-nucleotide-binding protein
MPTRETPQFHDLDRDECIAILDRNHIGRIAYSFRDRVDITTISYVYDDVWLYVRTEVGDKLVTMAHNRWVAFEVGEIDGIFDWRTVVVRGGIYVLDATEHAAEHHRAVKLLRTLIPETFRDGDPAPFRDVVLRIHLDDVSGRAAMSGV